MRRCLVSVFGPHNALPALAAARWHGEANGLEAPSELVCVVHNPGRGRGEIEASSAVVSRLLAGQPYPTRCVALTSGDIASFESGEKVRYLQVLQRFRALVAGDDFTEVYYPHALVGRAAELMMNAYPAADRVTFGDGLGQLYDRTILGSRGAPEDGSGFRRALRRVREMLGRLRSGGPWDYEASIATLILPVDPSGRCLRGVKLEVVPRNVVREIVEQMRRPIPDLDSAIDALVTAAPAPRYLILLGNLADGQFATLEHEAELYATIVRDHCPAGASIIIKSHPLGVLPVHEALQAQLGSDYKAILLPEKLAAFPLEVLDRLIRQSEVICISSTGAALAYLFDKKSIYALSSDLIERYIAPEHRDRFLDSDRIYRAQFANLERWDGRGVLWSGGEPEGQR